MRRPQINISLSRQPRAATDDTVTETVNSIDWERISTNAQQILKTVAITAVAAYAAKKAIDSTNEIAVIAATHMINK